MSSALYEGTIRHRRFAQRGHEFRHKIAMAYLDEGEGDAAVARALVRERTGTALDGPVRLLTLGRGFNPVRFHYCFDGAERLRAIVAEVTNTPWGERHSYVLDGSGPVLEGTHEKAMRVSPFMGMDQRYVWRAAEPGNTVSVHIESHEDGRKAFDATLSLRRRPGRAPRLPGGSLRATALIYGHAVLLRLKGVRRP